MPSGKQLVLALVALLVIALIVAWAATSRAQAVVGDVELDDGGPTGRASSVMIDEEGNFVSGGSGTQAPVMALLLAGAR